MQGQTFTRTRLFVTAWLLFAVHFSTNVVREHYPAFALVDHHTFKVDEYRGLHADIFVHVDGHSYVGNNVATSVFASIPLFLFDPLLDAVEEYDKSRQVAGKAVLSDSYQVDKPLRQEFFKEVSRRGLALRLGLATLITSVFLVAPLSALCVVAVFEILAARGVSRGWAVWLALVFGLGTPLFFRSANLSNNLFVAYFTLASFWFLWRRDGNLELVGTGKRLAAGFCAAMAVACDYSGVVSLGCLYGYLVLRRLPSVSLGRALVESVPFIVGSVFPIGFLLYSQWAMYGDPFLPGQYWMPDVNYTDRGWRGFSAPSLETFLLNLMHPSYGLAFFGPILLLGLLPSRRSRTETPILARSERVFTLALVGSFLLFCAANQYSRMQFNTGFRYLLPLVPFLFLAACQHLVRLPRPVLLTVTILAVLHTWILCMARDCNPNNDTWRDAPSFAAWLAQFANETVPASYLRIWNDGLQLPWLRVLRLTGHENQSFLNAPWLPGALLALAGLVVAALWMGGRRHGVSTTSVATGEAPPKALPTVAVMVPVLNEAHVLEKSIRTLRTFLLERFPYPAHVVIVDNGSTDGTSDVAHKLAGTFPDVSVINLSVRGRGRALRTAWGQSQADIMAYMDVDLSTELEALEKLCRAIHEDGYDLATGSRLLPESRVTRCFKRELLSRGYNLFIKLVLWTRFSDAQCGFKAVSRRVAQEVIPLIKNQHWFFDTELLVLSEKLGYRIKDVPVRWLEDSDSRVKIASTVWEDVRGVFRLRRLLWGRSLDGLAKAPACPTLHATS